MSERQALLDRIGEHTGGTSINLHAYDGPHPGGPCWGCKALPQHCVAMVYSGRDIYGLPLCEPCGRMIAGDDAMFDRLMADSDQHAS